MVERLMMGKVEVGQAEINSRPTRKRMAVASQGDQDGG